MKVIREFRAAFYFIGIKGGNLFWQITVDRLRFTKKGKQILALMVIWDLRALTDKKDLQVEISKDSSDLKSLSPVPVFLASSKKSEISQPKPLFMDCHCCLFLRFGWRISHFGISHRDGSSQLTPLNSRLHRFNQVQQNEFQLTVVVSSLFSSHSDADGSFGMKIFLFNFSSQNLRR